MSDTKSTAVCIIGAGSMGISTGYTLSLAGAHVTFLVLPAQKETLAGSKILYSFDDNTLKTFSGYEVITDPAELSAKSFDLILVTLDGTALRAEAGTRLVDEIGQACRGTDTGVILGSVGIDHRTWFLKQTGLAGSQVTNGVLGKFVYEAQAFEMPHHDGVRADLLAQADFGFAHASEYGFTVDLSAPAVAHRFADLYNKSGVSKCSIIPANEFRAQVSFFPYIMAWEQLDWRPMSEISASDEAWALGQKAAQEVQQLSFIGEAGQKPSDSISDVLGFFQQLEASTRPFDFAAFNRYHHGGKVNEQDHNMLRELLSIGTAEGADMPALTELVSRLPERKPAE